MYSQTPDARLMTCQDISTGTGRQVPDTEGSISRPGDSGILIGHFQATHSRRMPTKKMDSGPDDQETSLAIGLQSL